MTVIYVPQHPGHDPAMLVNDIALIKLEGPVKINTYVSTVPMAPSGADFDDNWCYISGWGVTQPGNSDGPRGHTCARISAASQIHRHLDVHTHTHIHTPIL